MEIKKQMIIQLEQPKNVEREKANQCIQVLLANNQPNPKSKDIAELEKIFDEHPELWEKCGNIAERVKDSIIFTTHKADHLLIEATKRKIASLRDSLGWQTSSELERLLIEQICLNWFRLNILENIHDETFKQENTIARKEHLDKLLTQAQKRYLRACESLAKIRKLLSEAELKEQQARNKRSKSVSIANKLLKDSML
jgi:hypothetical protein